MILLVGLSAFLRLSQFKYAVHPGHFDEVLLHKSVDDLLERWRQFRHSHTWLPWAQQGRMQLIILELHWLATHSHICKVQRACRRHDVNDTDSRSDLQIQPGSSNQLMLLLGASHILIQNGCRQFWSRTCEKKSGIMHLKKI